MGQGLLSKKIKERIRLILILMLHYVRYDRDKIHPNRKSTALSTNSQMVVNPGDQRDNRNNESQNDEEWQRIIAWLIDLHERSTGKRFVFKEGTEQEEATCLTEVADEIGADNVCSTALRLAAAFRDNSNNSLQFKYLKHCCGVFLVEQPKALTEFGDAIDIDSILAKDPNNHNYRIWRIADSINRLMEHAYELHESIDKTLEDSIAICGNDCDFIIKTTEQTNADLKILSDAHRFKGVLHFWRKEWSPAIKHFSDAMDADSNYNPQCLHLRGQSLLALKNYKCALEDYETYISLMPLDPSGFWWKRFIYREMGKGRLAALALEEGKNSVNTIVSSESIALLYFKEKDWQSAINHFEKSVEANEILNFHSYNYLGISLFKVGRYNEAKTKFNTYRSVMNSMSMHEGNVCALSNIGRCHYELKEYMHAIIDFSKAIQIDDELLERKHRLRLLFWRGLSMFEVKSKIEAIEDLTIVANVANKYQKKAKVLLRLIQREGDA